MCMGYVLIVTQHFIIMGALHSHYFLLYPSLFVPGMSSHIFTIVSCNNNIIIICFNISSDREDFICFENPCVCSYINIVFMICFRWSRQSWYILLCFYVHSFLLLVFYVPHDDRRELIHNYIYVSECILLAINFLYHRTSMLLLRYMLHVLLIILNWLAT